MNELVLGLMLWIARHTEYDTATMPPPRVVEMSPQELTEELYADVPHMKPQSGVDPRVWALYSDEDGPNGTVYILAAHHDDDGAAPDEPSYMNPVFQERLLHELIHHAQRLSGARDAFPCRNHGEAEAYALGGRFLDQRHATDPLPNRNFWAQIYSRC